MNIFEPKKFANLKLLLTAHAIALFSFSFSAHSQPEGGEFIQLKTILDEQRGHCIDIAGSGENIDTLVPLQSHTCKRHFNDYSDEQFIMDYPLEGNIYNAVTNTCLDVVDHVELGAVYMRPCTESKTQIFDFNDEGELKTAGMETSLCVTTAPSASHPAVRLGRTPEPGVTNVARLILLRACADTPDELKLWEFRT